jgi:trk system potassium uptake protein TrkA
METDEQKRRFVDIIGSPGQRFGVIGLGQFGRALALGLVENGGEVIAVDADMARVEMVKDTVDYAVQCDATDVEALEAHALHELDAVIVAIGSDFESTLLVAVEVQRLGCKRVIARAYTDRQRHILQRVGIDEVLSPEEEMGHHIAHLLMRPDLVDYLDLSEEYAIMEVQVPDDFVGKTMRDLDLPTNYGVSVITIRRPADEGEAPDETADDEDPETSVPELHVLGVPRSDTSLQDGDTLVVFGKSDRIDAMLG